MNRFKKEIRRRGVMLESDFDYLPYDGIETVVVTAEQASYSVYHVCAGWTTIRYNRDMTAVPV